MVSRKADLFPICALVPETLCTLYCTQYLPIKALEVQYSSHSHFLSAAAAAIGLKYWAE